MKVKLAIQMDAISAIDIKGDTTFALALEAQARGYEIFYYEPDHLRMAVGTDDKVEIIAALAPLKVQDVVGAHYELGAASPTDLRTMDVVLMRQDPPFDMAYIAATHFLEKIHPETLVVNAPFAVRNAPEKLWVLDYPDLTPPTLLSRDRHAITAFRARHKDIILKPIFGNGGAGIFRVQAGDENFGALLDMFLAGTREPFIAQAYLPAIRAGDKRLILIDGEAAGALNRVPQAGEARANVHIGGVPEAVALDERDYEIAARIGPALRDVGIILAGVDIIGGLVTEVNVTSPTCIREIKALGGADLAVAVWDAIEKKL
ncbi:MAG: glutathione synthase [Alphaproteobacteria bacterium]|nr:glutathione synthase [Alphaproteobacteria bacterium]